MISRKTGVAVLVLALMNVVIYYDYWTGSKLFTGKDFLTGFGPLLIFQSDCLQELSYPLWNPFMNFGYPFVEHFSNSVFFPTHLIMGIFTGSGFEIIQREMLFWIILGGIGIYFCVREFGHSVNAGIIAAAGFMFSGQLMALPQWHVLVYNAACFPFFILGYHRAERQNRPLSLFTIAFISMSIFGGYVVSTVLSLYIFALYVAVDALCRRRIIFGIKFLAMSFVVAALITAPKLIPIYNAMEFGPRIKSYSAAASRDNFNIINFYNFMSFLLPVKYYFSLYIGLMGIIALLYGAIRKKLQVNALVLLFILTAWLLMVDSDGNISLLRSATMFLPLMKLVRNEWIEWFFPSIFAILYLSKYVDIFLAEARSLQHYVAAALTAAGLSAVFFLQYNTSLYFSAYLAQLAFVLLWLSVVFINNRKQYQTLAVVLLLTVEFLLVFNRVNIDETPVREGDRLKIAVVDQGSVSRSYMDDNLVWRKFYAVAVDDQLRPSVSESRKRPYLISGLGEASQINAYPEQYGMFIDSMNLKYFAGWWYNVQERFDFIKLKESPLLAAMDRQPLFVYFDRASGMAKTEEVSLEQVSCSGFEFDMNPQTPGFLLLHQMFDDRWKVIIDGKERLPVKADDFFMGIDIAPGDRKVVFTFRDQSFLWSLGCSGLTLAGLTGLIIFRRKRNIPPVN